MLDFPAVAFTIGVRWCISRFPHNFNNSNIHVCQGHHQGNGCYWLFMYSAEMPKTILMNVLSFYLCISCPTLTTSTLTWTSVHLFIQSTVSYFNPRGNPFQPFNDLCKWSQKWSPQALLISTILISVQWEDRSFMLAEHISWISLSRFHLSLFGGREENARISVKTFLPLVSNECLWNLQAAPGIGPARQPWSIFVIQCLRWHRHLHQLGIHAAGSFYPL